MHALPGLQIQLFGGFRLTYEGKLVTTFAQARLQVLLAYLLLHRHSPQPREMIAYLFWPDSSESQARTNLRQLLHHLQRALPAAGRYLQIEKKTIQWRAEAAYTLDVADFEQDLLQAERARLEGQLAEARRRLESAVELYQGDLLPACYDDWVLPERERLRQSYFSALDQLIALLEAQHDYRASIIYAEALLRQDPLREITYQQLMRLHALNGDRASALRVYHTCVSVLDRELGVKPSSETQNAYRDLLKVETSAAEREQKLFSSVQPALIGRQKEWSIFQNAWMHAIDRHPGLVLISGEAGIGKTRLGEEFLEWVDRQGGSTGKTRSYAAEGKLSYAPVTELLRAEPFRVGLSSLDPVWLTELAHLMPELLAERSDLPKPEPITSGWQRRHLFEALARAIGTVQEPLLLLFDDLQWCDRDTLEWLHYLLHFRGEARLLIIGVARSEEIDESHPLVPLLMDLRNREQITEIELGSLDKNDTIRLAEQVAGKHIDPERASQLYLQSEGNPLFVVEMISAEKNQYGEGRVASGVKETLLDKKRTTALHPHRGTRTSLPSRVYTVIQTRLQQLSPTGRALAGLAATIGRSFSIEILSLASEMDDEALVLGMDELWRRQIVREQNNLFYDFSHDLIREVAYAEISPARRRLLHRRVARALEQIHAANLDEASSQIAVHYEQAGLAEQAVGYYQRAAKVARSTFSNAEVIYHMNSALALLPGLPQNQERKHTELSILLTLGEAYMLSQGYGYPDAERVLLQAWRVLQTLDRYPHTVSVLAGLWVCYYVRGDMPQEIVWAEKMKLEMQRGMDESFLPHVYFALIGTAFSQGDFLAAKHYGESQFSEFNVQKRRQPFLFGYDPDIAIMAYWGNSLWMLGYSDQARAIMHQAVALSANTNHPGNILLSLSFQLVLHQWCGEVALTLDQAGRTITYAIEKLIPYWIAHGHIFHGWALAQKGQADQGQLILAKGGE